MSRIGKKEIIIPKNVFITLENGKVIVKGIFGYLEFPCINGFEYLLSDNKMQIKQKENGKKIPAFHGLMRAQIQNMILGVSQKFSKVLIVEGVGYKFQLDKNTLTLNMGYSHNITMNIPDNIEIKLESFSKVIISGINKQLVGLFASQIRSVRPPEPYKGKGIRYENEVVLRKIGKTGKK